VQVEVSAFEGKSVPDGTAEALVRAVAEEFTPLGVIETSGGVGRLARRGGWAIGASYRLWLRDDVVSDAALPAGMTSDRIGRGWLYTVADDVTPEQVVAVHEQFRAMNGLDVLPH
jgi:hypothetical protein